MVTGAPRPKPAGGADTCVVTGLDPRHALLLRAQDGGQGGQLVGKIEHRERRDNGDAGRYPSARRHGSRRGATPLTVSVTLAWTAPGGDGNTGTAALYDIRYSTSPLNDATWAFAMQASGSRPRRRPARRIVRRDGARSGARANYFAVKTADEKPNWSTLSNIAIATTATP